MTNMPAGSAQENRRYARLWKRVPVYAWILFTAFLCTMAVFILMIVCADRLSRFGLLQQTYYLVLVLMGLTAAGFLFGVLQSTATWTGNIFGGKLRLSGSVVGAALVVYGGYCFIPKATSFPLTVYVHGEGGTQDIVLRSTGRVFLKLGPEISSELIGEYGQAVFPRIPADYRGQQVPVGIESDDYEATISTVTLESNSIDLTVKKKVKHFKLLGIVLDEQGNPLPDVHVMLPQYRLEDTTKSDGSYKFQVSEDREQLVDLVAEKQGYQTKRMSPTLGDPGVIFFLQKR
jgi:uncharacterized membrane protein (DUF485 family)